VNRFAGMIRRLVLTLPMALLYASCGGNAAVPRPDAGTLPQSCLPEQRDTHLGVRVVDSGGHPIAGAEITAKNLDTGKTVTATSNEEGETVAVGTSMGSGSVQVVAKVGTAQTDPCVASFVCGECFCTMQPGSITLTVP
jgi:hypothetical protein